MKRAQRLLLLVCLAALPARADTLSREDIEKLLSGGVMPAVIVAKLGTSQCAFRLTSDDVLALTKDGVPQEVIRAMIACSTPKQDFLGDPCAMDLSPSAVAFPDLEWDRAGLRFDFATLFVSTAGLCLKRSEDQVRRPIPWTNVAAICEESGYRRYVYFKLRTPEPGLAPLADGSVLIFKSKPATIHPLVTYIRKVQPELTLNCAVMEEQ